MFSDLLQNHSRTSSFSNLLAYTTAFGIHFSCTLGMGDTQNDKFALFLGCNLSRLLCMSTSMSSDLFHSHSRTSSFFNLFAYKAASDSHFSCTLGIGDTRNDNLALFLGCNLSRLLWMLTRMSSDLSNNHSRTSSFSNLFAYTTTYGSHCSCTLGMGDTQNDNLAPFI